jgi:predicted esterase
MTWPTFKGHGYFLFHSPDDQVCPFAMAERAARDLKKHGAKVKLTTYKGKHGWQAGLYESMRQGIEWLEENHATLRVEREGTDPPREYLKSKASSWML